MSTLTIAVDLAKNVFEVAVAAGTGTVCERRRLTRAQYLQFWGQRAPCRVVMEACATAHFWGRFLSARGFEVVLLPPHYVKPFRRRNKTDRADCDAILEASRSHGIHSVAVKSQDQQAILALHRVRAQWLAARTARINHMRGLLREFGVVAPAGAQRFVRDVLQLLDLKCEQLPARVRRIVLSLWEETRALERRIEAVNQELESVATHESVVRALCRIPGIGVLTATALFATVGNVHAFPSGRRLASWLGLTPREFSSGSRRRLGRISKQGDAYVRMLLIHGARAALNGARRLAKAGKPLTHLQAWALKRAEHAHSNKAVVALANKTARIAWAVWHHERVFDGDHAVRQAA